MFLDKMLFDEFDRTMIEHKIIARKQVLGMKIYKKLFIPKKKCAFCGKEIPKKDGGFFSPGFGTIHTNCEKLFLKKYKYKGVYYKC